MTAALARLDRTPEPFGTLALAGVLSLLLVLRLLRLT